MTSRGRVFIDPVGEVVAVASEHDEAAGTQRGPNTIFVFTLDGLRIAHFGDFGQTALRDEQANAIGQVDLAFVPVGDGPTIGAAQARAVADRIGARWVVPMHHRTPRSASSRPRTRSSSCSATRCEGSSFETAELPSEGPVAVVPAVP